MKTAKIQSLKDEIVKKEEILKDTKKEHESIETKQLQKIVSLEKKLEKLSGVLRVVRQQGVKIESTENIIYSVDESTTEKNDLESKIENFNQLGKEAKKSMVVTMVENSSGNFNLTTGDIDGMIETINSMNPKPKCVKISKMPFGIRAGKLTLFINVNKKVDKNGTPLNKKHALNLFKKLGYEVVLK
tara:strand:- start:58 stop:618 length:561 start_codon:yes stop_codon:yes gene_type:complete